MLTTQKELLNLAADAKETHQLALARDYLEQAHSLGFEKDVVELLLEVYFVLQEKDHAYLVIKGLPDLFSDLDIFKLYQRVLVEQNYFLEQQKLIKLLKKNFSKAEFFEYQKIINEYEVRPVDEAEQQKIIAWFEKSEKNILMTTDLFVLYRLDLDHFVDLCEYYFLNRYQNNRIKVSLISELIMLGVDYDFNLFKNKVIRQFNPIQLELLNKSKYFVMGQEIILNNLMDDPSELQLVLNNFFEISQALYPFMEEDIQNLQNFLTILSKNKIPVLPDITDFEVEKYQQIINDILQ